MVLEFRNRGRVLQRDNEIKLRRTPADPNVTIEMMFQNRILYTPPAIGNCIEDGRFVIHLSMYVRFYIFIIFNNL